MAESPDQPSELSPDAVTFPLKEFLDFHIERGQGRASASLVLADQHMNPNAVAHGSVAFTLMDTAMGAAVVSILDDDQMCATVEIHTRFHRPVAAGPLRAEAEVLTAGRRLIQLQARTVDDEERLVASATSSFAVFPAR